jgi:hypothetical protein
MGLKPSSKPGLLGLKRNLVLGLSQKEHPEGLPKMGLRLRGSPPREKPISKSPARNRCTAHSTSAFTLLAQKGENFFSFPTLQPTPLVSASKHKRYKPRSKSFSSNPETPIAHSTIPQELDPS